MPVNNDVRKMPLITKENAKHYYEELLSLYHYETDYLYNKVPILKNLMEHHILKDVTNVDEFKFHFEGEPLGQWKWLIDRKEVRSNYETRGFIPQALIAGIEHLFKDRNEAEHKQDMDEAGFLGHFRTVAKTIKKFGGVPFPQEIQDILDGENRKGKPDGGRKRDEKDSFEQLEQDMNGCRRCNRWRNQKKVLYNGSVTSRVMFIAKAPGNYKGSTILVKGQAGKNFQRLLDSISWQRESIFITNAMLCYAQNNEEQEQQEQRQIEACRSYLVRMIELVKPDVVVPLGKVTFNAIREIEDTNCDFEESILAEPRGRDWFGRKLFPLNLPGSWVKDPENPPDDQWVRFFRDFKTLASIVHPITGLK